MDEIIEGYINIYRQDNLLCANGGIYVEESKAIESGKCFKGYLTTLYISNKKEPKNE